MTLKNPIGLIGDFIGSIPVMIDLAKRDGGLNVIIHPEAEKLWSLIPKKYNIQKTEPGAKWDKELDLSSAFKYANIMNLHMIQAHYFFVDLPVPKTIPRPELSYISNMHYVTDYIIAPFSRSLPAEQLWQKEKWQQMVNIMQDKQFVFFGNSSYDDKEFLKGPNVRYMFDMSFDNVCLTMKNAIHGVISVVTGISHLAFALNVPNYLFINQGTWGKNPEAEIFDGYIPNITVQQVVRTLRSIRY